MKKADIFRKRTRLLHKANPSKFYINFKTNWTKAWKKFYNTRAYVWNIATRSCGIISPPERIINETVGSYRMETRHYLAEVV